MRGGEENRTSYTTSNTRRKGTKTMTNTKTTYVAYHFELKENHENTDWWKNGGKEAWGQEEMLCGITFYPEYGERFEERLSAAGDFSEAIEVEKMDAEAYQAYKIRNWID